MPLRPRPEIDKLIPSVHGGPNEAELRQSGLTAGEVIDFSVCSNPFMPPPELSEVCSNVGIDRLPDSEATMFRERLSEKLGVHPDNILAGNGSLEPLRLVALSFISPGDPVLILEPTFGEYRVACHISGAEVICQWANGEDNFTHHIEETVDLIKRSRPRCIFICNPNNPSGRYLSKHEITDILDASKDTLLVIDEAYISFVENNWSSLDLIERDNVVILRSMSKDYALAGLRLGYIVARREIVDILKKVKPPWNVNAVAQQAGIIALDDSVHLERAKREIIKAKQFLTDELRRLGFAIVPSETHFFLMRVDDTGGFRTALLKQGLLVRDCTSFGLPEYVRIATRTIPECQILINAIKEMIKQ